MNYLIYTDATSTTGKELLAKLKEEGVNIKGGTGKPTGHIDTLIRWGSAHLVGKPGHIINNAKSIQAASDKWNALKVLKNADISVPKVMTKEQVTTEDFPVLGRKIHHVAGNDIVLCMQKFDLPLAIKAGCKYFTKYIPTAVEYRVHVYGDNVIKVSQKVLTDEHLYKDAFIRNFDEGFTFKQPTVKLPTSAKGMALDAVDALGLTFGAVDLVVGDDGKPYILEVNTAPGLKTDSSLEVYVNKFKQALA